MNIERTNNPINTLTYLFPVRYNDDNNQTLELKKLDTNTQIDTQHTQPHTEQPVFIRHIEDTFTPSKELAAAMEAKAYINNGLVDAHSFRAMAQELEKLGVLNKDDMLGVDVLTYNSPDISFRHFSTVLENENLSREMRGLIARLVQKLYMLNYVNGGVMG